MERFTEMLDAARAAVLDACAVCRQVQSGLESVRAITKDDRSPVTVADFASQAVINRVLRERLGAAVIVGEESSRVLRRQEHAAHLEAAIAAAQEVWPEVTADAFLDALDFGSSGGGPLSPGFWTVDPIDGTRGFLRGRQYAVCLAYISRGEPVIAALGCPNLPRDFSEPLDQADQAGCLYTTIRGAGVYEEPCERDSGVRPIRMQRLDHRPHQPVTLCESAEPGHSDHQAAQRVSARLGTLAPPVRLDSQCKYAVVARGQADAYLRIPVRRDYVERIWDHAAGALVALEAGCAVTDLRSRALDFSRGEGLEGNRGLVVAPPMLHGRIIGVIHELGLDREQ